MTLPADIALLGFTTVEDFQRAWNLGPRLVADGIPGPVTLAAAGLSARRHRAGLGDVSANYSASEAACHCGGRFAGCRRVVVIRELLQALEALRHHRGDRPLPVVDIYRCPQHNAAQSGSATDSQHLYGAAADFDPSLRLDPGDVRALHVFSGLGSGAISHTLQHGDVRHASGHNTTGSTVTNPATWLYAGR